MATETQESPAISADDIKLAEKYKSDANEYFKSK